MLNSKKILVSLVVITLLAITFGSVKSLATQPIVANVTTSTTPANNTTGAVTITTSNNTVNTANTAANNTVATNNTTNNAVNKITNTSSYNTTNTTKKSLPYAGTDSTIVFIVLALAISAVYAYKKVLDYNI